MMKLALIFLLPLTIIACSSDEDRQANIQPQVAPSPACPVLNGTYQMAAGSRNDRDMEIRETLSFDIFTKVDGSQFSYGLKAEGPFVLADGQPHPVEYRGVTGAVTITCAQNVLEVKRSAAGAVIVDRITPVSDTQVKLQTTDGDGAKSGTYTLVPSSIRSATDTSTTTATSTSTDTGVLR